MSVDPVQPQRWATPRDRHEQAVRVLRKVRGLLSDQSKWTAGSMARDQFGADVQPHDPGATRWCGVGAISKVAHDECRASLRERREVQCLAESLLARALSRPGGSEVIPHVNDGLDGYNRIMAGLSRAVGVSPRRRDVALKGWDTRRKRAFDREYQQWLRAREAESVDPRPEVMVFGGTITGAPTSVTERKVSASVSR